MVKPVKKAKEAKASKTKLEPDTSPSSSLKDKEREMQKLRDSDDHGLSADEENFIFKKGKVLAFQAWDSNSPFGGGEVCVVRYKKKYYVTHDAGLDGPFSTKAEAIEAFEIFEIGGATVSIWDKQVGYIFDITRLSKSEAALVKANFVDPILAALRTDTGSHSQPGSKGKKTPPRDSKTPRKR